MVIVENVLADKGYTIWSVGPEDSAYHAIQLMAEKNIGALPVVQSGKLVGILSERDYARKLILQKRDAHHTKVKEIMTSNVCSISPATSIDECMQLMSKHHFRHLPVVLEGKLIGMVSVNDVVKIIISEQKDKIHQLENNITWSESY